MSSTCEVVQLVGTSPESGGRGHRGCVDRASESLRDLPVAEVVEQDLLLEDGSVSA